MTDELETFLRNLFFPYYIERSKRVQDNAIRFVHYTSTDAAMSIIRNKQIWMRETSCMNDFMEVEHGATCLISAYNSDVGEKFKSTLNSMYDGFAEQIQKHFDSWLPHLRSDTYLTCVSEHHDDEDILGRLSMWRAYSRNSGIALVMNTAPFFNETDSLEAYSCPVEYLTPEQYKINFRELTNRIEQNKALIQSIGRDALLNVIFDVFKLVTLATKHPGFSEEKEWRVIYSPALKKSPHLIKDIVAINGVAQPIYKIPLKNVPEENLVDIEIPELINRVIIGPTEFPAAVRKAFVTLLEEAGVSDAAERVFVSSIPLRKDS